MKWNDKLRAHRVIRGWTQKQAADALSITQSSLSHYETARSEPNIDTMERIANVFESDVNTIFFDRTDKLS